MMGTWTWNGDRWHFSLDIPGWPLPVKVGYVLPRRGGDFFWKREAHPYTMATAGAGTADNFEAAKASVEAGNEKVTYEVIPGSCTRWGNGRRC